MRTVKLLFLVPAFVVDAMALFLGSIVEAAGTKPTAAELRATDIVTLVAILAAVMLLAACQTTETNYKWPGYQFGLSVGPNSSPVKAELPRLTLPPSNASPARAAYGGIWEGWACRRNRTRDVKVAVTRVTDEGAIVEYARGSARGKLNITVFAKFSGNVLRGHAGPVGAEGFMDLVLGLRSDGNMNIFLGCPGVLKRVKALPETNTVAMTQTHASETKPTAEELEAVYIGWVSATKSLNGNPLNMKWLPGGKYQTEMLHRPGAVFTSGKWWVAEDATICHATEILDRYIERCTKHIKDGNLIYRVDVTGARIGEGIKIEEKIAITK